MTEFRDYERPQETVLSFKYLVRLLTETNENRPGVIANLWKSRNIWPHMDWILGWEGADTQTSGRFYTTVVQSIPLFRPEMWVVTPRIKRILEGFRHMVARQILSNMPRLRTEGT